jgi:septum formation protein
MQLILASTSPRRRELLGLLQIPFEVCPPTYEEGIPPGGSAAELAVKFASGKAASCSREAPDALVLGSDTLIELGGRVLGKPADCADARAMLLDMAGRSQVIYTAVVLRREREGLEASVVVPVTVWMKNLTVESLEDYLRSGESFGKAGAYSIQGLGGNLVDRIEGDFTAAVGLPLRAVAELLQARGVSVPIDVNTLYRTKPYPNWCRFG